MAELGVAASVVGILSFGIEIAQGLLQYYGSWKDQDSDVADMCASLDSLSRTLAVLSETFQRHDPPSMSIQKRVVESVDRVNIVMKKLEDELKKAGAHYSKGPDWGVYVQTDGLLITGQNPASSVQAAKTLLKLLKN